jgi:uncharacterized membrane protein YqjE
MDPKDCFGVAVRIIGLLIIIVALLYLISAIIVLINPNYRPGAAPMTHYLLPGLLGLVFGLYLLRGARHIVRFAYPAKKAKEEATRDLTNR